MAGPSEKRRVLGAHRFVRPAACGICSRCLIWIRQGFRDLRASRLHTVGFHRIATAPAQAQKYMTETGTENRPPTRKGVTAMIESKSVTKDPVCGMTVDEATAVHTERDGKTFYFCGDHCRQAFLSTPAGVKSKDKPGGCC